MSENDFQTFLQTQCSRFKNVVNTEMNISKKINDTIKIINAITNVEVVSLARNKLIEEYLEK